MSTGDSFETRFEKIDNLLRDPKSEVNSDCLLVSGTFRSLLLVWGPACFASLLFSFWLTARVSGMHNHREKRQIFCFPKNFWSTTKTTWCGPFYSATGSLLSAL